MTLEQLIDMWVKTFDYTEKNRQLGHVVQGHKGHYAVMLRQMEEFKQFIRSQGIDLKKEVK